MQIRAIDQYDVAFSVMRARMAAHFLLSPKGEIASRRYFVIGHPRSGTTTLHRLFRSNGIASFHGPRDWRTDRFEAFSDMGHLRPIRAFDRTYPNAKFILNFRPLRNYLTSLTRHFPGRFTVRNAVNEVLRREAYLAWALRYFTGRTDFIVVNIEAPGAWDAVADFCDFKTAEPEGGMIHNRSKRPVTPANARVIDTALDRLGLLDEARGGCIVSRVHGARRPAILKLKSRVHVLET